MLLLLYFMSNAGYTSVQKKKQIKLKGQETTPSSTYLDVFTADRVSDSLTNSFWLEFKNFKIVNEKKLKMEDVNKGTIDLDLIDICWISLSRWVRLSSYSLDDSLFRKEKWLRHTTRKNWSSVWSKCLIHYIRRWKPLTNLCLRKTSCLGLQEVQKMERNTIFYGAC